MATFTEYEAQQLVKTLRWNELTVNGISGLGYPFEINCMLTVDDDNQPAIFEDRIYVDYLNTHNKGNLQSDMFAPLRIEIATDCNPEAALYVNTISAGGRTIFENEDFGRIKSRILSDKRARESTLRAKGMLIEPDDKKDSVTEKINKFVGKHIALKNQAKTCTPTKVNGILIGCEKYASDGCPSVILLDGVRVIYNGIAHQSSLYSIKTNGDMRVEAVSGDVHRLREKIEDRIKRASNPFGRH